MDDRTNDRFFAGAGIASVVLTLAGAIVAMVGGKTHELTVGTSTAKLAQDLAKPATTATWIGAYTELLGTVIFLCFAVWACVRLARGVWSAIGIAAATAYTAVTVTSLALMNAISYRAGHGIGTGLARTLVTVNESMYVTTWFLFALFLVAAGVPALAAGRRVIGGAAVAIAAFTFVVAPISFDGVGQASALLFFAWIAGASIALLRREPARAAVPVPA
ncbi:MAG TPA: hypothetical protein VE982_05090 [Gaiellaceae bacterium]|nr:hypothetical protein [Gaiellaceae bacterium]